MNSLNRMVMLYSLMLPAISNMGNDIFGYPSLREKPKPDNAIFKLQHMGQNETNESIAQYIEKALIGENYVVYGIGTAKNGTKFPVYKHYGSLYGITIKDNYVCYRSLPKGCNVQEINQEGDYHESVSIQ